MNEYQAKWQERTTELAAEGLRLVGSEMCIRDRS